MSTTSVSLILRLSDTNDDDAWQKFVSLYSPLLLRWTSQIGLARDKGADLVQDVLLLLMQKLPEFEYDEKRSFRGWLRTITSNKCRDFLRREKLEPQSGHSEQLKRIQSGEDAELFSEEEYHDYLIARALQMMERDFEPTTWQACWKHVVSGRTAAEVGEELGISENAVYLAKMRVLQKLRHELDGLLG